MFICSYFKSVAGTDVTGREERSRVEKAGTDSLGVSLKIAGNRRKGRSNSLLRPGKRKTHSNAQVLKLSTNEEERMGEN